MKFRIVRIVCLTVFIFASLALAQTELNETREVYLPFGKHIITPIAPAISESLKGVVIYSSCISLNESERSAIAKQGIRLGQYLGSNTWWARISEDGAAQIPSTFALFKPSPEMKLTPGAAQIISLRSGSESASLLISFMSDTPSSIMERLIRDYAVDPGKSRILYDKRILVDVPRDRISKLLKTDDIICVEPGNRKRRSLNKKAAVLSRTDLARSTYNLDGTGIVVGVWDGGKIFSHKEFGNRLSSGKHSVVDSHATHVAGTIGATGIKKTAMGMAPGVIIRSYDYYDDIHSEMVNSKQNYNVLLTNNSYGYPNGWEWEGEWVWYGDEYFGSYSSDSRAFDKVVYKQDMIIVFAAGNDRQDTGPGKGEYFDSLKNRYVKNVPQKRDGPYICIGEEASAKNTIAVGALADKGSMSAYSSWGPTLDGRVKPEVTANGNGLLSTLPGNGYGRYSGTSMASPAVTGSLALVAEYWQREKGEKIAPDIMRALLAVGARDNGRPGPDFSYGYGILDTEKMVTIIAKDGGDAKIFKSFLSSDKLNETYSFSVASQGSVLRVALAWIDPPAAVNSRPTLINNLNLKLTSPSGKAWYPWILDKNLPEKNAVRGVNNVDNIELVMVNSAENGSWTISVDASKSGLQNRQRFALVVIEE